MYTSRLIVFFLIHLLAVGVLPFSAFSETDEATPRNKAIELCNHAVVKVEHAEIGGDPDWQGSGVFFSERRLVTNAHVVGELPETPAKFRRVYSDEDMNKVIFWIVFNGKKYRANFIGRDPDLDFAVLEVAHEIPGIVPAIFGNSEKAKRGDRVMVCGNPLGMENTITQGIISGKEKKTGFISYEDYIQTDAAINQGNSGGPLVSLEDAMVLGIVNSKINGADNMGYAIPINLFKSVQDELRGTIKHSWLGISFPLEKMDDTEGFSGLLTIYNYTGINEIVTLEKIRQEIFGDGGVLVTDVMRTFERKEYSSHSKNSGDSIFSFDTQTPAFRAGIEIADIIKDFNGHEVKVSKDLIYAIFRSTPHQETTMHVIRFSETGERHEEDIRITPVIRIPESSRGEFY